MTPRSNKLPHQISLHGAAAALALLLSAALAAGAEKSFRIEVVDDQSGRGVPLVELTTVNNIRCVTDSNGIAAFDEPGLFGLDVFFSVMSHGYEFPADGFGLRGKSLRVTPGGTAKLPVRRINIAQRLYRTTGAGIYRDSVLTGAAVPIEQPLLNAQVFGSDSVVNAVYRGKIYWFWGDTLRPGYPLGNFHVPGATSLLPAHGGLDPAAGVNLSYWIDEKGFARPTAEMPGEGPTWIDGLTVLRDAEGRERMFAAYVKVKPPLEVYRRGLAEFDDAAGRFTHVTEFDMAAPVHPGGHPLVFGREGTEYVLFAKPYPLARVGATSERLRELGNYEAYTCLKEGSRLDRPEIDRDGQGRARYSWKRGTPCVGPAEQKALIDGGYLAPAEVLLQLRDHRTGEPVAAHGGSVYWNAFRKRWVMIAVQAGGTSFLGEVWYAEADTPLGPWVYAAKVATHEKYSFYNPKQHPMFDADGGRTIFFEGTYTNSFSGNPEQTPRYDYNQVMYSLDLSDERLVLPVAVYEPRPGGRPPFETRPAKSAADSAMEPDIGEIAFFACDRAAAGLVAVCEDRAKVGRLIVRPADDAPDLQVLFYSLPADCADPPATTVPLYEFTAKGGRLYSTKGQPERPGLSRATEPLCRVWRNPYAGN